MLQIKYDLILYVNESDKQSICGLYDIPFFLTRDDCFRFIHVENAKGNLLDSEIHIQEIIFT